MANDTPARREAILVACRKALEGTGWFSADQIRDLMTRIEREL